MIMKREIDFKFCLRLINNGPVVLIGTKGEAGFNAAPAAWSTPAKKDPPTVALFVSPTHLTWENIEKMEQFTLNIPGENLVKETAFLGGVSGYKYPGKLEACSMDAVKGKYTDAPIFPACLGHLECKLISMDKESHLITGEVVYALAEEECFYNHWRIGKGALPLHHLGGEFYECGGEEIIQPRIKKWP